MHERDDVLLTGATYEVYYSNISRESSRRPEHSQLFPGFDSLTRVSQSTQKIAENAPESHMVSFSRHEKISCSTQRGNQDDHIFPALKFHVLAHNSGVTPSLPTREGGGRVVPLD